MVEKRIATVGMFDGVHAGHRFLIRRLQSDGRNPLVVTFPDHPLRLIAPDAAPKLLTSADEKRSMLERLGVEVEMLDFNESVRSLTALQFIDMLRSRYGVDALMLGFNNHIGSDRRTATDLATIAPIEIIECEAAPVEASSSQIRALLSSGDLSRANRLLSYPYCLAGQVTHGLALGRRLGFPTANIVVPDRKLIPATGVYAATASLALADPTHATSSASTFRAVVNIGHRPTVGDTNPLSIEAHLIGFEGDIYGVQVTLSLVDRLRPEQRFPDIDSLRRQIQRDVLTVSTMQNI